MNYIFFFGMVAPLIACTLIFAKLVSLAEPKHKYRYNIENLLAEREAQ